MQSLTAKALAVYARNHVLLGVAIFFAAGSVDFWEGWIFLTVFLIPQLLIIVYFLRKDPALIGRRLKAGPSAENRTRQKIVMSLVKIFFAIMVFIPGYDHRFGWSHVPAFLVITADAVILLGFFIQFCVFKENSFASVVVAIVPKQTVISTGPYALVRHPFYSGVLLQTSFLSIALGSWWGLLFAPGMLVTFILRLLDEEKLLRQSLPGYEEYCQKVPYRLIPHIW
jgi:protein-S-isoprenylcysteine O-methyltransferase Ste14